MSARKIIDSRSQQAKDQRLRKAHIGMDGKVIGGEDVLTQNRVTVPDAPRNMAPRPTMMPDLLAEHKARNANKNDAQVQAYRGMMRQQADGQRVSDAVVAARTPKTGVQVTDMRPSGMTASRDGNPRGMSYLNELSGVFREQGAAEAAEAATGKPRDWSKAGVDYAKNEAERRAAAKASPTLRLPANASRAVLTDPKYGGSGVGYATTTPRTNPLAAKAFNPMREINRQIASGTPAPKVAPAKQTSPVRVNPLMPPKTTIDKPTPAAQTAMVSAVNRTNTKPPTQFAPELAPMAEKVGYAMGSDGLSFPDAEGKQFDRDGYMKKNGQRYGRNGLPVYGPTAGEIGRKIRGLFSR